MNKHMKLVNRYLADNDSVSLERLHANYDSAADAADAAAAAATEAAAVEAAAKKAFFQKVVDANY